LLGGDDAALHEALGIVEAPWKWSSGELASDVLSTNVCAVIAGAVWGQLAECGF
jgi:hypothetical protein